MATDKLTPAQSLAVERRGGPILISAAAGSGKTRVIVERLMRRILSREEECNVNDFLIITFTKKAASELRERIARELALRLAEEPENRHLQNQQSRIYLTQISTVHSFCAELLREFAYELDIPADFRMLDETEARALREQIAEDLMEERYASGMEDPNFQNLVDGLGIGRDDRMVPQLLLQVYNTAQCRLYPDQWLTDCQAALAIDDIDAAEKTIWGASQISDFHDFLCGQEALLRMAVSSIAECPALEKYLPLFEENTDRLRELAALDGWDALWNAAQQGVDFGRLPVLRNCDEPALQERVKDIRTDVIDRVRKWLSEFYAPSSEVLDDLCQTGGTLRSLISLTQEFSRRYAAEKLRQHTLDFGDLEHNAVRLLLREDGKTPTELAVRISERFREIMVDEYQDTNEVQDSIFRAISRNGNNRFMVGDVKQSIYRFRLADPRIFLQKYREYPDAGETGPEDRQRILLSHNFRSGEAILEAVNAVCSTCMSPRVGGLEYGPDEALHSGVQKQPLPQTQVELHCLSTKAKDADADTPEVSRAEAAFAAGRILRLLTEKTLIRDEDGTRPVQPGDIVILLRSPKNTAGAYLDALRALGIPATSDSGESILDTKEVETLLCLLKVIDNVHRDIPLAGVLLSPIFGVSATELALAKKRGDRRDLYDALREAEAPSETLRLALACISRLRDLARTLPLYALFAQIRSLTGMDSVYGAMDHGTVRLENLRLFEELAASFAEGGKKSLHQFLAYVEVLREQGGVSREAARTNAVTVMSIHKSKGLEFPVVLLCGLSKRFNTDDQKALVQFHSELGVGCSVYDRATHTRFPSVACAAIRRRTQQENLSEELRVLYVAMTRARDMLIMTCCSGNMASQLSRLANRISPETVGRLAEQAGCMGDWVLLTALLREEAGALHQIGGRPDGCSVSSIPWQIRYQDISEQTSAKAPHTSERLPDRVPVTPEFLKTGLSYRYPFQSAATIPMKITATQLKGRKLDEEAVEGAATTWHRSPSRRPNLIFEDRPLTPAQRGVAMHQAMQYLDFARVSSCEAIKAQLDEMQRDLFLTKKQAEAVDPAKLYAVFQSALGAELAAADRIIREYKFSVLIPSAVLYPGSGQEKILLQGVTDCCLIHSGAITVVDFKTDRIRPGGEAEAGERYRPQLDAYSMALSMIFDLPVRRRLLYFFSTGKLLEL